MNYIKFFKVGFLITLFTSVLYANESNCTSKVAIGVLASKIISFEITPLCPK